MASKRNNLRYAIAALAALVVLAGIGSIAARQIRSPAQIAADTAAPAASRITAPVERRALATEVIVRGTVRYGTPQEVVLPASGLKTATQLVSRLPKPDARLGEGDTALVVSGRPVFTLNGATPMHRDLGPGMEGQDVRQLESALARAGFGPESVDGRYDGSTAGAVSAFYVAHKQTPFGPTDAQATDLRSAAAAAAAARDAVLQMRLALRTAAEGTKPADINQARLDAVAAAEQIPTARAAIATARDHEVGAKAAIDGAKLSELDAWSTADRDIALADADVITKDAAVDDAVEALAEAQRQLAAAAPDTPSNERATLAAAVRHAGGAIGVARGDLTAAQKTAGSARAGLRVALDKVRGEGRRATDDLRLARAETRSARASLAIAERKHTLARTRIGVLQQPPDTALERRLVTSARQEAGRTQGDLARLAERTGVQVPADEVLFFPTLPLRVDALAARRGAQLGGSVMTVTNSRLAIDSSLSVGDAKLVRHGMRVTIEEQDLRLKLTGRVSRVADKPGTTPTDLAGTTTPDPARTYVEVLPGSAPPSLVGASVKLGIAVQSTQGKVLAVPIGALSVAADGSSRVELDDGSGKTRFVTVLPGLAAQGFVELTPADKGALEAGDRVVVGSGPSAALKAPTGAGSDPPGGGGGSAAPPDPGTAAAPAATTSPGPGAASTPQTPAATGTPEPVATPARPTPEAPTPGATSGP